MHVLPHKTIGKHFVNLHCLHRLRSLCCHTAVNQRESIVRNVLPYKCVQTHTSRAPDTNNMGNSSWKKYFMKPCWKFNVLPFIPLWVGFCFFFSIISTFSHCQSPFHSQILTSTYCMWPMGSSSHFVFGCCYLNIIETMSFYFSSLLLCKTLPPSLPGSVVLKQLLVKLQASLLFIVIR